MNFFEKFFQAFLIFLIILLNFYLNFFVGASTIICWIDSRSNFFSLIGILMGTNGYTSFLVIFDLVYTLLVFILRADCGLEDEEAFFWMIIGC